MVLFSRRPLVLPEAMTIEQFHRMLAEVPLDERREVVLGVSDRRARDISDSLRSNGVIRKAAADSIWPTRSLSFRRPVPWWRGLLARTARISRCMAGTNKKRGTCPRFLLPP